MMALRLRTRIAILLAGILFGLQPWTGRSLALAQAPGTNPIIRDVFTADPAALVDGDTVYLYTGHDEAKGREMFTMWDWLCFSTKDMKTWTPHGPVMRVTDFKWAVRDAWASQTVKRNGKYYFYAAVQHGKPHYGKAIGVAISDGPTGPFVDARGTALITDEMTPSLNPWDDIDPTVLIDDDGTAWLAWGNPNCYLAKLKPNMIELDGPIQHIYVPNYTEGPWLSKRNGLYYLTYAAFAHQGFSERVCYATASRITGPWTYRGIITGAGKNSYTIQPSIIDFKGQSYFFYHFAGLTLPDGETGAIGRRAVCLEYLYYNPDGTIQPIKQTVAGVSVPPHPAPFEPAPPPDLGQSDAGVTVTQNSEPGANQWPGKPDLCITDTPRYRAIESQSFIRLGVANTIGQTFTVEKNMRLGRIALYAGDGFDTDPQNLITLALFDLGEADSATGLSYSPGNDLLGEGKGLKVAYQVQAPGLLLFDFDESNRVALKAGHKYALELQGREGAPTFYWRRTTTNVYAGGSAFRGRAAILDKQQQTCDFAMALYDVASLKDRESTDAASSPATR